MLQRSLDGGAYQQIAALPASATTYSDSSAAFNHQYTYRLQSVNAFGQSGYSNIASAVLINLAPRIATLGPQVVSLGEEFKLSVDATDPEDGKAGLTYALLNASAGAAIDANGQIHGWFGEYLDEMRVWTVKVTDNDGLSSTELISILVAPTLDSIPHATTPASAVPLTPTTLTLSVIASANGNSGGISYLWETISHPGQVGLPTFSTNDNTDASQTVATLHGAGTYVFRVIMSNDTNYPGHADVSVTVDQSLGSVVVTPLLAVANPGSTQTFTAQALDQFGLPMATQPTFAWSISGGTAGGTINSTSGVYTRPLSVTGTPSDLINATATVGGITKTGIASVTVPAVAAAAPTLVHSPAAVPLNQTQIRLTVLGGNPGGVESDLIYVWSATNLPTGAAAPSFSANGTNSAKTVIVTCDSAYPLNYTFSVTIQNRQGMTVSQSVTIADNQTFTKVVITPQQSSIGVNRQVSYMAQAQDQYGRAMVPQPTNFTWSVTDASNTILHTGSGASFAYTPTVDGTQKITATTTIGSVPLTGQAGLTVIPLGPPIRQIVSLAGNGDGSPQTISADMPVSIISYNPDGTPAPWALWLIPTGGGGDGTGGGPVLLASGSQSVGQPGSPQQVATIGPSEDGNGTYTLTLLPSASDPTAIAADSKTIEVTGASITSSVSSTDEVDLRWNTITNAYNYTIYRSTSPGLSQNYDTGIADVDSNSYIDNQVVAGTTYFYLIVADLTDGAIIDVGRAMVTTPDHDGPLVAISSPGVEGDIVMDTAITNDLSPDHLTATGINDLEIFLSWTCHTANELGFNIQLTDSDPNNPNPRWVTVGTTSAKETTFTVRDVGFNGNWLQENHPYYFRVRAFGELGQSDWSDAVEGEVKIPTQSDTIMIVAGHRQSESWLEESWGQPVGKGNSVGTIWKDLIAKGYNVFMTAEADWPGSVTTYQGGGEFYAELNEEIARGWANKIGLVGYSHGGGTIFNMSQQILADKHLGQIQSVLFTATIDAVKRHSEDDFPPAALAISPGTAWGANSINYWEPNGVPDETGGSLVHGQNMSQAFVTNTKIMGFAPYGIPATHANIYKNHTVISGVEDAIYTAFPGYP